MTRQEQDGRLPLDSDPVGVSTDKRPFHPRPSSALKSRIMAVSGAPAGERLASRQLTFQELIKEIGAENAQEKIRAKIAAGELEKILVHEDPNSPKRSVRFVKRAVTLPLF